MKNIIKLCEKCNIQGIHHSIKLIKKVIQIKL